MSINISPKIEYKNIEILEFYFNASNVQDIGELEVSMNVETKNADDGEDTILSKVNISITDKITEKEYLRLSIGNILKVFNLFEYSDEVDGKLIVKKEIVFYVANLVISTARGIFWEKTRGTFLKNIMLPIIDTDNN